MKELKNLATKWLTKSEDIQRSLGPVMRTREQKACVQREAAVLEKCAIELVGVIPEELPRPKVAFLLDALHVFSLMDKSATYPSLENIAQIAKKALAEYER